MAVKLRGHKFHYRFLWKGTDYSGACEGCSVPAGATPEEIAEIEAKARKFEENLRADLIRKAEDLARVEEDIRRNRTVRALVENYKFELTGGHPIRLDEAYPLAAAKPSRRQARSVHAEQRERYWDDFTAYMAQAYPDVTDLAGVRRIHCETYVKYLADHGRFIKEVAFAAPPQGRRKRPKLVTYRRDYLLAPKTIKAIVGAVHWVFTRLEEDAGLVADPWRNVVLPEGKQIDREVFTPEELRLIWQGIQHDDFCRPLFLIAANTGLTEGDICTLKWSDIDWTSNFLRRDRRKTGVEIRLPLLPELAEYLRSLPRTSEYILPEHAARYQTIKGGVSTRVMAFLRGLGIETSIRHPGRKAVSVKDLHSMRHVFCYRAKRAGIPESTIQKFVGHAVLSMTQHYADHDTLEDMRAEFRKLKPLFLSDGTTPAETPEERMRRGLAEAAYTLPLEVVQRVMALLAFTQPSGKKSGAAPFDPAVAAEFVRPLCESPALEA